jgi:hypothetical protein
VIKREFCEKRLKDSHEFHENWCYENCNLLVGANEILPKFSTFFVRRGPNLALEMTATVCPSA